MRWLKKALGLVGRQRAESLVTKGYVAAREGRRSEALKLYEEAAEADETLAVAWLNAALCRLESFNEGAAGLAPDGRTAELDAIATLLERAVSLAEVPPSAFRSLARVSERRGAFLRAEECWQKVLEALAEDPATQPLQQQEARRALDEVRPRAALERSLQRARAALTTGVGDDERKEALAGLQAILEAPPVGVDVPARAWALAGTLARRLRDLAAARQLLEHAVTVDGNDLEALRELASTFVDLGELPLALQTSLAAYRKNPLDAGLVCNVGVCHLALGDAQKAGEFLAIARDMAPKDPIVQRAWQTLVEGSQAAPPSS